RRDSKRIWYALAGPDVPALWDVLRGVAQVHRPHTEAARTAYLGPDDTEAVDTETLRRRMAAGDVVVLDVRPTAEYEAGRRPGAVHIPLAELADRWRGLPADREIVAYCRGRYCVLAHDAARLLAAKGLHAARAVDGLLEWRLAGLPVEHGAA